MKILLITAWYFPFTHPRAHRWTALAEHWAAKGHTVHVLTARQRAIPAFTIQSGVRIHRVGFDSLKEFCYFLFGDKAARGRVGSPVRAPGLLLRMAFWLYKNIWKKVCFPDDACVWYFPARRKAISLIEHEGVDLILSVSLPFTGHLLARALHKQFPRIPWLADIGDPFSFETFPLNNHFLYGRLNRRLERSMLMEADHTVVTTSFALEQYEAEFGSDISHHMHVIPPLLHPMPRILTDSKSAVVAPPASTFPLKIGYFGALYAPVRTPDAFLAVLEETLRCQPKAKAYLEVHFYGEIFPAFYEALRRQPLVRLHGLRSREEARSAMQQMDILLNIGNQTAFQLPSKAVDYLASGKPVINLSYTPADAFAAFWGNQAGLLTLKVEDGKVNEESLQAWMACVAGKWPQRYLPVDPDRLKPYALEAVAAAYERLFQAGAPPQ